MTQNHALIDLEMCQFLDLGYHIIDSSGIPETTHDRLFEAAVDIHQRRAELSNPVASLETVADNLHVQIPLLNELFESDAIDGALSSILGPRYFRYGHLGDAVLLPASGRARYGTDGNIAWHAVLECQP